MRLPKSACTAQQALCGRYCTAVAGGFFRLCMKSCKVRRPHPGRTVAIKAAPIKAGFLTGHGWNYDAMAAKTGGDAVCGICRCGSLSKSYSHLVMGHHGPALEQRPVRGGQDPGVGGVQHPLIRHRMSAHAGLLALGSGTSS